MELFKIIGRIAVEGGEKANKVLEGVGNVAKKAGKVMAAGLAAGATAVAALTKQAVESYANYEQLVGGVETLFGAGGKNILDYAKSVGKTVEEVREEYNQLMYSQNLVMDNAANAYKTAGMSANEYMETVTSFSASLLQSLGGDTAAAAKYADMAIIDMSDNANKMGTDISSIQSAYQGFAKQNYTMLDNLKLGYGGTQEEMKRLLKDAGALAGKKFDISNYSDIIEAIHTIQEDMGIAGTTSAEAMTTIQGSFAATKSAWQNLLTGFADKDQDLGQLVTNLVDSAKVAIGNLVPIIAQTLSGISTAIQQIMPVISAELPGILQDLLPGLLSGATTLIVGLVTALPGLITIIVEQLPALLTQIFTAIQDAWPAFCEAIMALALLLWDYICQLWEKLSAWFDENVIQPIVDAFTEFKEKVKEIWDGIWGAIKGVINKIIGGVENMVNKVIGGINGLLSGIGSVVSAVGDVLGLSWSINLIPEVNLPRLEKGGILEKGQIGLLEGNGAEAVVPLERNKKWISAVAADMNAAIGGDNEKLQKIIDLLEILIAMFPEAMVKAFETMKFKINNREFARMVREYA